MSGGTLNSSRVHLRRGVARFAGDTEAGMLVLDAGAGRSPYRSLFEHARYEAADFAQLPKKYAPLDYVCDLTDIPVEDGRFDLLSRAYGKADIRWKYPDKGMPKNYVVVARRPFA